MIYNFDNSYTHLSKNLYQTLSPPEIVDPTLLLLNTPLLSNLGIDFSQDYNPQILLESSANKAFAQAYAGHQFGHFTTLGDGRAMILGEHLSPSNDRFDIQLKGSGQTQYSRGGDGKATVSSMTREYLYSYAMKNLGIKTSESLAVLSTNQKVVREEIHDGAILIRVMESHIRFGTFEFVSHFCSSDEFKNFTDYTIKRHYSHLEKEEQKYLKFFQAVMEKTIAMVVEWYRVGFIHGVMNTDNMSITGETFDYGPCAFMNYFDLSATFSQIDRFGRYSFGNQKDILKWNLSVLGKTLIPLLDKDISQAEKFFSQEMIRFDSLFQRKFHSMMHRKLGIQDSVSSEKLIGQFYRFMDKNKADYTNTFLELMDPQSIDEEIYQTEEFKDLRSELEKYSLDREIMRLNNPRYILRNYLVEEAIDDYKNNKKMDKVHELLDAVKSPYTSEGKQETSQKPPSRDYDRYYTTHCNT